VTSLAWILLALNVGMIGDVLLKKGGVMRLIMGAFLFSLTAFPTWKAYQSASFSSVTIFWQSCYLIEGLILGFSIFGDAVTPRKLAAVVLALLAVALAGEQGG
jgi:hypothetical protein